MEQSEYEKVGRESFEFNVDPKDSIFVQRLFFGRTDRDNVIEKLEVPTRPGWLIIVVNAIRFYQRNISKKLGNRCVFDPSCSHYSEIAYREKGFIKGTVLTIKRLCRCRAQNGGIDELI